MSIEFLKKIKVFILEGESNTANNVAKSLLIGIVSGLLIGMTGKNWDFGFYQKKGGLRFSDDAPFQFYGTTQAVIGGIIVFLILFLKYNRSKQQ